jgi:hypothetical protein
MICCRLTNLLKEHKPYFLRVAPYIVADLLQYFETYTLCPEVKVSGFTCSVSFFDGSECHWVKVKIVYVLDSGVIYQFGSTYFEFIVLNMETKSHNLAFKNLEVVL